MTLDKVKDVIVDTVGLEADAIVMEAKLQDDLDIDSLDAVEISLALEESFEITIPQEELEKFETVKDIVEFIDKQAA